MRFLRLNLLVVFLGGLAAAEPPAQSPRIQLSGTPSGWQMLVDGKPFYIKGVGCNSAVGEKGEDYLLMAKQMGANTVRTWGGAPRSYLDKADAYDLKVNLGFWLNPIRGRTRESYRSAAHRLELKQQILSYVREMKDHPALLSWNIGNEVFKFTAGEAERQAFGAFLEDIIKSVHTIDPHHPVIYTSAAGADLPYLKRYVPSLDIVGLNIYGGLSSVLKEVKELGLNKPVLITEFGPKGSWDQAKDKNGLPFDPSDQFKAGDYAGLWRQILSVEGRTLGGIVFVLGEQRNQDSVTWFNVNYGDLKRQGYWQLYTLYTGKKPVNRPPVIANVQLSKHFANAGENLDIKVKASDADGDLMSYSYFIAGIANDPIIVEPVKLVPSLAEEISPGTARLKAPREPGLYRVYSIVEDSSKNAAIANRSLRVVH